MKIKIEIDTSNNDTIIEVTYDDSKEDKVLELAKGRKICDELFDEYHNYYSEG